MGKKTQKVQQTNSPPGYIQNAQQQVIGQANQLSQNPLQQYGGPMQAGFTPAQQQAFNSVNNLQGMINPWLNAGAQYTANAATPIAGQIPLLGSPYTGGLASSAYNTFTNGPSDILRTGTGALPGTTGAVNQATQQYMSPYLNDVIGGTLGWMNNQDAQQQNQLVGNAVSAGAWGGDRAGVAQGVLGGQQALAKDQVIGQLEQQGYGQAQQTALGSLGQDVSAAAQQNQLGLGYGQASQQDYLAQLQAAQQAASQQGLLNLYAGQQMGSLGSMGQQAALEAANAQLGIGNQQQQQAQQALNIPYQMFQQQQAYPYQQLNFLDQIINGTAGLAGGTTTGTQPSGSLAGDLMGGLMGANSLGMFGSSGLGGLLGIGGASAGVGGTGLSVAEALPLLMAANRGGAIGYSNGGSPQTEDAPKLPLPPPPPTGVNPGTADPHIKALMHSGVSPEAIINVVRPHPGPVQTLGQPHNDYASGGQSDPTDYLKAMNTRQLFGSPLFPQIQQQNPAEQQPPGYAGGGATNVTITTGHPATAPATPQMGLPSSVGPGTGLGGSSLPGIINQPGQMGATPPLPQMAPYQPPSQPLSVNPTSNFTPPDPSTLPKFTTPSFFAPGQPGQWIKGGPNGGHTLGAPGSTGTGGGVNGKANGGLFGNVLNAFQARGGRTGYDDGGQIMQPLDQFSPRMPSVGFGQMPPMQQQPPSWQGQGGWGGGNPQGPMQGFLSQMHNWQGEMPQFSHGEMPQAFNSAMQSWINQRPDFDGQQFQNPNWQSHGNFFQGNQSGMAQPLGMRMGPNGPSQPTGKSQGMFARGGVPGYDDGGDVDPWSQAFGQAGSDISNFFSNRYWGNPTTPPSQTAIPTPHHQAPPVGGMNAGNVTTHHNLGTDNIDPNFEENAPNMLPFSPSLGQPQGQEVAPGVSVSSNSNQEEQQPEGDGWASHVNMPQLAMAAGILQSKGRFPQQVGAGLQNMAEYEMGRRKYDLEAKKLDAEMKLWAQHGQYWDTEGQARMMNAQTAQQRAQDYGSYVQGRLAYMQAQGQHMSNEDSAELTKLKQGQDKLNQFPQAERDKIMLGLTQAGNRAYTERFHQNPMTGEIIDTQTGKPIDPNHPPPEANEETFTNEYITDGLNRLQSPTGGQQAAPQIDPRIAQAKEAIARGADRNAVIQKAKSMGIDTSGL